MCRVVAVEAGGAGEEFLVALAWQQISIVEHRTAKVGQQPIARSVHSHQVSPLHLHSVVKHGEVSRGRVDRDDLGKL